MNACCNASLNHGEGLLFYITQRVIRFLFTRLHSDAGKLMSPAIVPFFINNRMVFPEFPGSFLLNGVDPRIA